MFLPFQVMSASTTTTALLHWVLCVQDHHPRHQHLPRVHHPRAGVTHPSWSRLSHPSPNSSSWRPTTTLDCCLDHGETPLWLVDKVHYYSLIGQYCTVVSIRVRRLSFMISYVFTSHWSECVTLVAEPENINQKQIIIRNNLLNFQSLFLHIFDNNFQKFEIISHDRTPPLTGHKGSSSLYRNLSMPASTPKPSVRIQDPGAGGQSRPGLAARSGSGAKEMILMWVQARIKDYPVRVTHIMMMTT